MIGRLRQCVLECDLAIEEEEDGGRCIPTVTTSPCREDRKEDAEAVRKKKTSVMLDKAPLQEIETLTVRVRLDVKLFNVSEPDDLLFWGFIKRLGCGGQWT